MNLNIIPLHSHYKNYIIQLAALEVFIDALQTETLLENRPL